MSDMYKKIKRQNGEVFARTLRDYHNGLLEIEGIERIVRHAGRDAAALLPYLMSLLASNDDVAPPKPEDPFVLLDRAGYDAFYADTLDKQNSIKKYFEQGELLCTFNDSARYKKYHIVHAVKKDVASIRRKYFKGREQREDTYGTSVISIQMLKTGGFISIKNRYNHGVSGCDNTFNSNPDNIIQGLSSALKDRFGVEFSASSNALPEGFVVINNQLFKYHTEENNIYYGDQAWVKDGVIHEVDRGAGDALFDGFLFDNKTKTLKKIDPDSLDSFVDDFNRDYGGNRGLYVQDGHLMLDGDTLIGAKASRITTLDLPALTSIGDYCLCYARALTTFNAPALTSMGNRCLFGAHVLTGFEAPVLAIMGNSCLYDARTLTSLNAPALTSMGSYCLYGAPALTTFNAPALTSMGSGCLHHANALTSFRANKLSSMGTYCLYRANALTQFIVPALTSMGNYCLYGAPALTTFDAPVLTSMGKYCLRFSRATLRLKVKTAVSLRCLFNKGAQKQSIMPETAIGQPAAARASRSFEA